MMENPGRAGHQSAPAVIGGSDTTHAHTHPHDCCGDHGAQPQSATALIGARALTVVRGQRSILDNISIDIHPREIVTLIGPNGSGKTTLVRALLGLEPPQRGSVYRKPGLVVGYVPQRFSVDATLPMTVTRFLSLGNGSRAPRIAETLAEVGAASIARQQLGNLSGGELQRVLLARALLSDPELLVLDEPARGVDYVGEAELYTLIGRLRDIRGLGVLLVSHDLHVVMAQSDRVICVNRHVCCSGIPETVTQHPEYARLFGPEAARAFGVYHHHHDHRHDLAGVPAHDQARAEPTAAPGSGGGRA